VLTSYSLAEFVECSSNVNKFVGKCHAFKGRKGLKEAKRKLESLSTNVVMTDIHISELVTSTWYKKNKRQMWTQHFVYFCREKQLYNLYRHTPPAKHSKGFVIHWKEKGAHFDGNFSKEENVRQPLLQLDDIDNNNNKSSSLASVMEFPSASTLKRYDFGAKLVTMVDHLDPDVPNFRAVELAQQRQQEQYGSHFLPPVVMSAAIGYSFEHFEKFIGTLREFYFGDVWLLMSKDYGDDSREDTGDSDESESVLIRKYLQEQNVHYIETHLGRSGSETTGKIWENINRYRFDFFSTVCDPSLYSLCLTTDFRDSIFQSNPFANIHRLLLVPQPSSSPLISSRNNNTITDNNIDNDDGDAPLEVLHVFEHNFNMSEWHYQKMKDPRCNLYEEYWEILKGNKIINGGSIIGSPHAFRKIVDYMTGLWKGCNDQVILNILVRANILTTTTNSTQQQHDVLDDSRRRRDNNKAVIVKVHKQGYGPMNVVGVNGWIVKDKTTKFMNRNCIVSPVVHQYDGVQCSDEQ